MSVILHDCHHLNRLEHGDYALCFDCGAERHPQIAPEPLPSLDAQHLVRVSERLLGPAPEAVAPAASGVPCGTCGAVLGSLHGLIAHVSSAHRLEAAGGR